MVLPCPHVEPGALYPEEVSSCVLAQLLQVRIDAVAAPACMQGCKALIGSILVAFRAIACGAPRAPPCTHAAPRPMRLPPASCTPQDAERETGQGPVKKAVISVPAYFEEAQREATIAAGAPRAGRQGVAAAEPAAATRGRAASPPPRVPCAPCCRPWRVHVALFTARRRARGAGGGAVDKGARRGGAGVRPRPGRRAGEVHPRYKPLV